MKTSKLPNFSPMHIAKIVFFFGMLTNLSLSYAQVNSEIKNQEVFGSLLNPRQGFTKADSMLLLDPDVRELMDKVVFVHKTPGLFLKKTELLKVFAVSFGEKKYRLPGANGHRGYIENLVHLSGSEPYWWEASYEYKGPLDVTNVWAAILAIKFKKNDRCIPSRAAEGYLDMDIITTAHHTSGPLVGLNRHQSEYAQVFIKAQSEQNPLIMITIGNGCVVDISLVQSYVLTDYSDDGSYN